MYKIQYIMLCDLSDADSELFDKTNLHDPALDHYWIDWTSNLPSYEAVALELIRALNAEELEVAAGYMRIKEYE